MRSLIVKILCGFTQLLKGSFPFENELTGMAFAGPFEVIKQQILSSPLLNVLFDTIRTGRFFAFVRSV
tara:strand:- start:503 stop:706 length:204 start_codon:yes stop_codon:yes gene_type:complete